jgi:NAD(P)-dependent dehydrogenase (short-subunit alcohol dehydrogenase family)
VADVNRKGAEALANELNATAQMVWTVEADVASWDSQRAAWETAEAEFKRIDYVFPIAGIGERRTFPNRPDSAGYEKPDLTVLDVDCVGAIYTISLAVQHFRRQPPNRYGFRGKSKHFDHLHTLPVQPCT